MIDFTNLQKMIDERYISVQKHPYLDLFIYNYTQKAQFGRMWNNETLACRGLIMDSKHNIIARPFPKFFNLQEALDKGEQIPAEDFLVTEKMDGSLGILYHDTDGKACLATRGSFVSEQAVMGTRILKEKYPHILVSPHFTHLFEIIYPQNRIVVDYGDMEDLVLLSVRDTQTGREFAYEDLLDYGYPVVKRYDGMRDFSNIVERPNAEGYVITFTTGQRFKIKFDEYVRLHRIVTGVNAKTIWENLRHKQPMDELLERVPDEFFGWVSDTIKKLTDQYLAVELMARDLYEEARDLPTRRDQAKFILTYPKNKGYSGIVFAMLDDKDYSDIIWRQIKPVAEKPFKEDIDA